MSRRPPSDPERVCLTKFKSEFTEFNETSILFRSVLFDCYYVAGVRDESETQIGSIAAPNSDATAAEASMQSSQSNQLNQKLLRLPFIPPAVQASCYLALAPLPLGR